MGERTRRLSLLTAALVVVAAALPGSAAAQGAPAACPATFEVLHDDRIGNLRLAAGAYTVTLLDSSALTCAAATDLFRQFLEDWDGRLPRPWVLNASTSTFTRGSGGTVGFSVAPASSNGGGGSGGHHPHGAVCPGTFQVLHDDRIGNFAVPAGSYTITLLGAGRLPCERASSYLARFLQDFDGILPRPWFLDPETGTFMRGRRNVGFRIKADVLPPNPNGNGGGVHPTRARCPGTFRVLNNDRIGALRLPRGPYTITRLPQGRLSCARASALFRGFLQDFDGVLPRPWLLNPRTGTFMRGAGSDTGFRVKRAL